MNFPVFSQLAGNFAFPETSSLETPCSSEESRTNHPLWTYRMRHRVKLVPQGGGTSRVNLAALTVQ